LSSRIAPLAARLGLSDEETLAIFGLSPLEAVGGEFDHLPEVEVLDGLTAEAAELAGEGALAKWVRASGLGLLEARDWLGFEDALDRWLRDCGLVA
jgi:hypothetical protein